MREILYKKKHSLKSRRKMITLTERNEDNECKTYVRKHFVYIVSRVELTNENLERPDVIIKKSYNTKTKTEDFSFRVKGNFYMTQERRIFQVSFCHSLRINIIWKLPDLSPKKSVTLT